MPFAQLNCDKRVALEESVQLAPDICIRDLPTTFVRV